MEDAVVSNQDMLNEIGRILPGKRAQFYNDLEAKLMAIKDGEWLKVPCHPGGQKNVEGMRCRLRNALSGRGFRTVTHISSDHSSVFIQAKKTE